MVKLQVEVIKVKTLVRAVEFVQDLRAVKTHCSVVLPKRGFTNINRKEFAIVNLDTLNRFEEGTEVTPALLIETGVVSNEKSGIKILGNGTLDKKITVKAHKFSASAKEAIENAGGQTEVV